MTSPQIYTARLEEKLSLNKKFTQFSFELVEPSRLEFLAGQYVSLKIDEGGERRAYSICSTPDIKHQLELLVDLSQQGRGAQFLQNLEYGVTVELMAPMGRFVVPENLTTSQLVFVATGSGVAPFRAMIEDQLRNHFDQSLTTQQQRQITLHWGMRRPADLFWLDEWQELAEAFPNFHFHPVLSQASAAWTLCKGHVTDCLSVHERPANATYFLCGNQTMIADTTALLTGQGVSEALILTEKFY